MQGSVWMSGLLASIVLFQIVAVPALLLRKNDLADVLWGPGFPLSALAAIHFSGKGFDSLSSRELLLLILISLWAARLFLHVGWRNLSHRQEDVRYNNWRKQWGHTWLWRSYLQVFVLQALIMFLFLVPVLYALAAPALPLGPLAYAGALVWVIGFLFEAVGDEQLRQFKRRADSKGKLMTTGLWSWSRHPNYFGEVCLWWGAWLITLELPGSWWTIIGPLGVTYLILKVSGVSMLEDLMRSRPGYAEYEKRVPAFFPLPPGWKK